VSDNLWAGLCFCMRV